MQLVDGRFSGVMEPATDTEDLGSDNWGDFEAGEYKPDGDVDTSTLRAVDIDVRRSAENLVLKEDEPDVWGHLVKMIQEDDSEVSSFLQLIKQLPAEQLNDQTRTGVTLLHYIVIYDRAPYIELLHDYSETKLDLNVCDKISGLTPLMWSILLKRKQCCKEIFQYFSELQLECKSRDGRTAWDLASPGSEMWEFLEENNLFKYRELVSGFLGETSHLESGHNPIDVFPVEDPATMDNIDLQVAGLSLVGEGLDTTDKADGSGNVFLGPKSDRTAIMLGSGVDDYMDDLSRDHFDFHNLLSGQYIGFSEFDIPELLNVLVSLQVKVPHVTTYPAALLFQCIRYADVKKKSESQVELLIHLAITKILSTISLRDSAQSASQENAISHGDIVVQSYWLGAVSYLYYYLSKDETFFKRYPSVLQELINTIHSIIVELTLSIHSRLSSLIESTLLEYTTIQDVEQTLYKKDWNFFRKRRLAKRVLRTKNKKRNKKKSDEQKHDDNNSEEMDSKNEAGECEDDNHDQESSNQLFYDAEILKHLYPPSLEEQMRPSPLKIVQIFGALNYVLSLHNVHPLFQQQCFSLAMKWFSNKVFNTILRNKKKKTLSRAHAIQIRLNLSTIEAWIKNNDLCVPKPAMMDDFMWQRFPFSLVKDLVDIDLTSPPLKNVAIYKAEVGRANIVSSKGTSESSDLILDTTNSLFYYQSFYHISQIHLEPVYQMLQWLQVATTLEEEESLDSTMSLLSRLNPLQLLKSIERYSYEVNEHKFDKHLKKKLQNMCKPMKDLTPYLVERPIPFLALPTVQELTDAYARGNDSKEYQPFLPADITEFVNDMHDENCKKHGITEESSDTLDERADYNENEIVKEDTTIRQNKSFFEPINEPTGSAHHASWTTNDEFDSNPW